MDRFCLDCSALLKGRSDKKFCDDQCRSSYNNQLKVENNSYLNKLNKILKKNRDILKAENPEARTKVKRETLLRKGFDFNYHTHFYVTQKGKTYIFCYEQGYLLLAHEEVLLVKREAQGGI